MMLKDIGDTAGCRQILVHDSGSNCRSFFGTEPFAELIETTFRTRELRFQYTVQKDFSPIYQLKKSA